jgi:prephenate dehydratase
MGAHSEQAIRALYAANKHPLLKGPTLDVVPCGSFADIFAQLGAKTLELALIPAENTYSGSFAQVYDLLWRHPHIHIVGETTLHDCNSLLVGANVRALADIEELYSHPHVLEQCSRIVEEIRQARIASGKSLTVFSVDDTAGAAQLVHERQLKNAAVLAHPSAAALYALSELQKQVRYMGCAGLMRAQVEDDVHQAAVHHLPARVR